MKTIKLFLFTLVALISFNACLPDDELEFVAKPTGKFTFTNSFLSTYVLPAETGTDNNIGIVFTWNDADFGTQTNISYELQYSIKGDFSDAVTFEDTGSTSDNQMTLTIKQLKSLSETYKLVAPATGEMHFRVRAFVGNTDSTTDMFTKGQTISVELLKATQAGNGIEKSTWGVVGSGYNNWGNAGADGVFYTTSNTDVIVAYVALVDGEIKFRENNQWGGDLGDANQDGILDADANNNIPVTAGDYKITINLSDKSYTIEKFSWGVVGSGYNDWGSAGPDAKFYYDYTSDSFKVSLHLVDGEIKFRPNNEWNGDFGDANGDGILDRDADNNITVTEGYYTITVNFNDNSYTIVEDQVWGVVGSGYNNWGQDGPDFALTHLRDDVYVGEIVTLIDGEIKFRPNNEWNGDFGDANADGVLDRDPDNNISVVAGNYRISIDFATNAYELIKVN